MPIRHEIGLPAEDIALLIDAIGDYAIFLLGPEGEIRSWNSGAARIMGYSAEEAIGSNFSRFYGPDDLAGRVTGYAKITRDLTERRNAEERLRQSEEMFRLLVASVRDYAIFLLDPQGNVATWNAGAQRIKGYTADEIIGRHFSAFYPAEDIRAGKTELELAAAQRDGRFE